MAPCSPGRVGLSIATMSPRRRGCANEEVSAKGTAPLGALVITAPAQASFAPEGSPLAVGPAQPYGVLTADFNRDGRTDAATVNGTGSNLSVFLRGPSGFAAEAGFPFPTGARPRLWRRRRLQRRRLPGRRDAELPVDGTVSIMLRQAGGGFVAGTPLTRRQHGLRHRRRLQWRRARGHRRPELQRQQRRHLPGQRLHLGGQTNPTGATPRDIVAADFNDDALPDLATTDLNGGTGQVLSVTPATSSRRPRRSRSAPRRRASRPPTSMATAIPTSPSPSSGPTR